MDAFHWLLYLTLAYVVILVIALAAGLIAIARALMITRKNLAAIRAGLMQVEAQTKPLEGSLQTTIDGIIKSGGEATAVACDVSSDDGPFP